MSAIRMRNIGKTFGRTTVIRQVDLDIEDGEFVVFVGPSGCGKSTLLRLVAGLEQITSGDLFIDGRRANDLPPVKRGVAMVFQSYALYPHMTVYENMAFGLKLAKASRDTIQARVQKAAKTLQIDALLERLPKELSGGQRQRVAIGRAIVREPGVFLFDEPLSNLDAALRLQTRLELFKLHKALATTSLYVTHDQVEAMTLADKIVLLNAGPAVATEGSIAQVGPPLELYHHPCTTFVAGFIGSPKMNFLPARLSQATPHRATVTLANGAAVGAAVNAQSARSGDPVTLGVRPEHLVIGVPEDSSTAGQVMYVERLGEASFLYLTIEGIESPVVVREQGASTAKAGDHVILGFPAPHCHLFNHHDQAFRRVLE
ncbi:MAG TPA: sn-glycerol-3-phosphate ABC transporter ATP-binding protein UgpC [Candidatus Competibacteraceae bacterium]|nr:sn-glycerol-3-phosphate ABC transporter ATP-binding protein UgpC [Candidatus Competibacteraceae bacterium]